MARTGDFHTQSNVFNRGFLVSCSVKPTELLEHRFTHGSASCPKRRSRLARCLMDVVVYQILILGKKIGAVRRIVVRSEDSRDLRATFKVFCNHLQTSWLQHYISIYEDKNVSCGIPGTNISGIGRAPSFCTADVSDSVLLRYSGSRVAGAIVDH